MKKIFFTIISFVLIFTSYFTSDIKVAKAAICNSSSECAQMLAENQKAVSNQKIQVNDVQSAVNSLNSQISTLQNGINIRTDQINITNQNITETLAQIEQKQKELDQKKADLNETVVTYYENGADVSTLEVVVAADNLSDAIDKSQYMQSISDQLSAQAELITQTKNALQIASDDLQKQKVDLQAQKDSLASQQQNILSQRQIQDSLLANAKGALSSLQSQQASIQASRERLTRIYSSGGGIPAGSQLITDIDSSWYYNQTDYPGVDLVSGAPLSLFGCLVTSIAMVATKYGHNISPPGVVDASNFTGGGGWAGFNRDIGISIESSRPVNWDVVNDEISQGHPVIVSVNATGQSYNSDGSDHFIVIKGLANGKYLIHDPYWRNKGYSLGQVISMKIINN